MLTGFDVRRDLHRVLGNCDGWRLGDDAHQACGHIKRIFGQRLYQPHELGAWAIRCAGQS